jgi:G:T-mismatch repair DNA endonuclease (very short patch repair protein)
MSDVHTPEQRSFNMSRIRSKDTKPELLVRKIQQSKAAVNAGKSTRKMPTMNNTLKK